MKKLSKIVALLLAGALTMLLFTARYDYKDTLLNAVLKKISEHVDTDHNVTVNQNGDWSNIGVVVMGNNEQSYIGISIRIKNIYK